MGTIFRDIEKEIVTLRVQYRHGQTVGNPPPTSEFIIGAESIFYTRMMNKSQLFCQLSYGSWSA